MHQSYIFLSPDNSHLNILHLLFTSYFLLKTLSLKTTMLTNENVMTLLIFHGVTTKELEGEPLHLSFALHSSPGVKEEEEAAWRRSRLPVGSGHQDGSELSAEAKQGFFFKSCSADEA